MSTRPARFRDPTSSYSLYNLARHPIDVECPRCAAHAVVIPAPADEGSPAVWSRRLVCAACGYAAEWSSPGRTSWWGVAVDPFFKQPLWLTTTVRGHLLWALNLEHLDLLERFVAAELRERGPGWGCGMSLVARLPAWLKVAANRDDILAATARLRAGRRHSAASAGPIGRVPHTHRDMR